MKFKTPPEWADLNVALSHDWLTGMRGGERVLEILCQAFPTAPVYTLFHKPENISHTIDRHPIRTSFLQHVPGIFRFYRYLLPLFPRAVTSMPAPPGDLLISTSHCVAKGLPPGPGARHLCYCFTPMRYAWGMQKEYFTGRPVVAAGARLILPAIRRWDLRSSRRVDRFVAISRHVQERILKSYGRESDIVFPPVDTDAWTPGQARTAGNYDLIVSALVPYKRVDLAIKTYNRTRQPLKIVGVGPELWKLKSIASDNIEFLGRRPDSELVDIYRSCRLLVFPGEEDFGIVPVEVQACGRPVVAFARGGLTEIVRDGVTGVLFEEQTEQSLAEAVRQCSSIQWDRSVIRANAERFSIQRFIDGLASSIRSCLAR